MHATALIISLTFLLKALALKGIDYEYKAVSLIKDGGQQVSATAVAVNEHEKYI